MNQSKNIEKNSNLGKNEQNVSFIANISNFARTKVGFGVLLTSLLVLITAGFLGYFQFSQTPPKTAQAASCPSDFTFSTDYCFKLANVTEACPIGGFPIGNIAAGGPPIIRDLTTPVCLYAPIPTGEIPSCIYGGALQNDKLGSVNPNTLLNIKYGDNGIIQIMCVRTNTSIPIPPLGDCNYVTSYCAALDSIIRPNTPVYNPTGFRCPQLQIPGYHLSIPAYQPKLFGALQCVSSRIVVYSCPLGSNLEPLGIGVCKIPHSPDPLPTTCRTGQYLSGPTCAPCPVNTHKTTTGILLSECLPCPANTSTNAVTGATSLSQCISNAVEALLINPDKVSFTPGKKSGGVYGSNDLILKVSSDSRFTASGKTAICRLKIKYYGYSDTEVGGYGLTQSKISPVVGGTFNQVSGSFEVPYSEANGCSFKLAKESQNQPRWEFEIRVVRSDNQTFGTQESYFMLYGAVGLVGITAD